MPSFKIILSPSKTLRPLLADSNSLYTIPSFLNMSVEIVNAIKEFDIDELQKLLKVNRKLAEQNFIRYQQWNLPFSVQNSVQAIFAFSGEVYSGLNSKDFTSKELTYAQQHIGILSGLYGVLRPLDLMQPYRLEMGSPFRLPDGKSLYNFWSNVVSKELKEELGTGGIMVNLASLEYSKVISSRIGINTVNIEFRENRPDGFKIIPILAKRARGLMTRFAVKQRIANPEELKLFDYEGYTYADNMSEENKWVFIR